MQNSETKANSKTAIITGASRGIGLAIAKQLAKDGMNVVLVASSDKERYAENFNWFISNQYPYHYVKANLADSEDRKKIVKEALSQFGSIEVLVNNAGVSPKERKDLLEMTEESFDHVIGINTKGTLFLTQEVAKSMISRQSEADKGVIQSGLKKIGTIINVTSISSQVSSTNRGEYCISKAGTSMVTKLFADRLAKEGILVHEVRPGVIATDMTSGVKEKYDKLIEDGAFPIPRWGKPEDVANVISLLADDRMTYTTGNHIYVDGGFHIQKL